MVGVRYRVGKPSRSSIPNVQPLDGRGGGVPSAAPGPPKRKIINRPEQALQIQCVQWVRLAFPSLPHWFVPQGFNLSPASRRVAKQMGLRAGVSDLHHLMPNGKLAVVELKADDGTLSKPQEAFRDDVLRCGGLWAEERTLDGYADRITSWVSPWGFSRKIRILPSGATQKIAP